MDVERCTQTIIGTLTNMLQSRPSLTSGAIDSIAMQLWENGLSNKVADYVYAGRDKSEKLEDLAAATARICTKIRTGQFDQGHVNVL